MNDELYVKYKVNFRGSIGEYFESLAKLDDNKLNRFNLSANDRYTVSLVKRLNGQ